MSVLRTTFLFAFLTLSLCPHVVEQFFVELHEQSRCCHHCPMASPAIRLLPIQKSNKTAKV